MHTKPERQAILPQGQAEWIDLDLDQTRISISSEGLPLVATRGFGRSGNPTADLSRHKFMANAETLHATDRSVG